MVLISIVTDILMNEDLLIRLLWNGAATAQTIKSMFRHSARIEVELPDNYNHALFARLHSGASPTQPERIDVSGGAELLARIAEVKGLEGFAELAEPVAKWCASVHVQSPPKVLIVVP